MKDYNNGMAMAIVHRMKRRALNAARATAQLVNAAWRVINEAINREILIKDRLHSFAFLQTEKHTVLKIELKQSMNSEQHGRFLGVHSIVC